MFNKRINKIKLALTTNCNLDCPYCFVKKTNEKMPWETAKKGINLLLNSPGKEKLLALYGGEPLLEADLVDRIAKYAIECAKKRKKKLLISMATNFTFLNKKILGIIKKNNIRISVSFAGPGAVHNKFRRFAGGEGTFDAVLKNLNILARNVPEKKIGISFVIFPSTSGRMLENFNNIREFSGIKNINFEIVQEFEKWSEENQAEFKNNYSKIILLLARSIMSGKGVFFINAINWEISRKLISGRYSLSCPFWDSAEIYPSGEIAFSPFLLNKKNKKNFIIGNINKSIEERFLKCRFGAANSGCVNCSSNYYRGYKDICQSRRVKEIYDLLNLRAARYIRKRAKTDKNFKKYISVIVSERCF